MFRFNSRPIQVEDWRPFIPMYSPNYTPLMTVRSGRGVGKSIAIIVRRLMLAAALPNSPSMIVCPLQSQSDRLSVEYFKPIFTQSPIRALLTENDNNNKNGNVRRRHFSNGSLINFSYAFLDAERVRGFHMRFMDIDEAQDFDPSFVPIVKECVSYPQPCLSRFGTSKTNDTTLELAYQDSTQSIWVVPCSSCGFEAKTCLSGGHILDMIGPYRDDVSEERPGTICPNCSTSSAPVPINPRYGWWEHRYPERANLSIGLHIPQIIMPRHFADQFKWYELIRKQNGFDNYSTGKFLNEVLGEPYDLAHRLIGVEQLKAAAVLGPNTLQEAVRRVESGMYSYVVIGVDWSGGGVDGFSRTAIAAAGYAHDGRIEIFYGKKFPAGNDDISEAKEICQTAYALRAYALIHDYNGVGAGRETVIKMTGYPEDRLMPAILTAELPGHAVIDFKKEVGAVARSYYHICKPRSYQFTTKSICSQYIRTFAYNEEQENSEPLLKDFTQLVEDYIEGPSRTTYRVRKSSETVSDDFASAANFACWALWYITDTRPNVLGT